MLPDTRQSLQKPGCILTMLSVIQYFQPVFGFQEKSMVQTARASGMACMGMMSDVVTGAEVMVDITMTETGCMGL